MTAPTTLSPANFAALTQFDELPDAANVALPVVMAIGGISAATVWRHSKSGLLPEPLKIGHATRWNVGALRRCLPARKEAA